MHLVGQEVDRILTLNEGGEYPARDKALYRQLNWFRVTEVIALKVKQDGRMDWPVSSLQGGGNTGWGVR